MTELRLPGTGRAAAEEFVSARLAHLCCDDVRGSGSVRGGATAAESALASFEVRGYARTRNEVLPPDSRGASRLSPYIRHGLLSLQRVWNSVEGGPEKDVRRFRDELLWQEYSRHWYATHGSRTGRGVRREMVVARDGEGWDRDLACVSTAIDELHTDGWLVNQQRMWLASHWSVRNGFDWRRGEDEFFRHLLDGSRAANRLGWQWVTGVGSAKPYGFSRWQVDKRAPGLCSTCPHNQACPIEDFPAEPAYAEQPEYQRMDSPGLFGPTEVKKQGPSEWLWLTAESLGNDPAMSANPELPAVFVFDAPLLSRLQLSSKRLVFLTETLADLGTRRKLVLRLGDPLEELAGLSLSVTHAPVPRFARLVSKLKVSETHPWQWLCRPGGARVNSFSTWRRSVEEPT